jgi:hypothetical protein
MFLVLIRALLADEASVDLLPLAVGSKSVLHKTISRLREAIDDKTHELILWDYASSYRLTANCHLSYSRDFLRCQSLFGPTLIDDIVRLIDERQTAGNSDQKTIAVEDKQEGQILDRKNDGVSSLGHADDVSLTRK